ncbi:MAG: hypothetical protein WCC78_00415, partial [Terriglobales bacterium]
NAPVEQIPTLIHEHREEVLRVLLENPHFEELHLCLLLGRADLSTLLLEEIASHKLITSYRVKRALAFHHNIPQTFGLGLVRELYTHDLVWLFILVLIRDKLKPVDFASRLCCT